MLSLRCYGLRHSVHGELRAGAKVEANIVCLTVQRMNGPYDVGYWPCKNIQLIWQHRRHKRQRNVYLFVGELVNGARWKYLNARLRQRRQIFRRWADHSQSCAVNSNKAC